MPPASNAVGLLGAQGSACPDQAPTLGALASFDTTIKKI